MIGKNLGHYRVLTKIGEGGMGEVYLAEDTKLDRKVALKVLPPELAESEERRARFEREAKALAALNHPNIITVYSVEHVDGVHFITMELVRGKRLSEIQPKNGFALGEFLKIAIPLANAVAAAHQEGIAHRDLKPDNVMVSDDGLVKVLDFGLAKPMLVSSGGASELPTAAQTEQGAVVGTVNYMSPEQAEGKSIDARSDIFSIGIVFFEMLTSARPFWGDTPTAVLSSILRDKADSVTDLKPRIPRELAKIIRRCLEKEPTRRFQTSLDLRNDLDDLKADLNSGELQSALPHRPSSLLSKWLVAGTGMLTLTLAAIIGYVVRGPDETVLRFVNPVQITSAVGVEDNPTWSPDGERFAYESDQTGNWDIWLTQLESGVGVNLTAEHSGDDRFPSWSPDGRQIAFVSRRRQTWELYTIPGIGGNARKVASLPAYFGDGAPHWSVDGREIRLSIRVGTGSSTEIIDTETQASHQVSLNLPTHEGRNCGGQRWSPDGLFLACVDSLDLTADATRLWLVSSSGRDVRPLTDSSNAAWNPVWSADGRSLFYVSNRGGAMDLWQQRLGKEAAPEGAPIPLTVGMGLRSAVFSSEGSRLAYSRGRRSSNIWRVLILPDRSATWADAEQITFESTADAEFVDVSPDGKRLALNSNRAGNEDVWILPSDGGEIRQLTTDTAHDWAPKWSPDGAHLAFFSYRSGNRDIWVMPSGGGPARQLTFHAADETVPTWSPDGREIAFRSLRDDNSDVWVVTAAGGELRRVTVHEGDDSLPVWSPDGRWLVFCSDRTGVDQLWRVPVAGGEPEVLTEGPGNVARWSPDGSVLFFRGTGEREGNLWALSLDNRRERQVTDLTGRHGTVGYALATDGRYLYFNWLDELGDIWVMDVVQ